MSLDSSGLLSFTASAGGLTLDDNTRRPRLFKITSGSNPYAASEVTLTEVDGTKAVDGYVVSAANKLLWEVNGVTTVAVNTIVTATPNPYGVGFYFAAGSAAKPYVLPGSFCFDLVKTRDANGVLLDVNITISQTIVHPDGSTTCESARTTCCGGKGTLKVLVQSNSGGAGPPPGVGAPYAGRVVTANGTSMVTGTDGIATFTDFPAGPVTVVLQSAAGETSTWYSTSPPGPTMSGSGFTGYNNVVNGSTSNTTFTLVAGMSYPPASPSPTTTTITTAPTAPKADTSVSPAPGTTAIVTTTYPPTITGTAQGNVDPSPGKATVTTTKYPPNADTSITPSPGTATTTTTAYPPKADTSITPSPGKATLTTTLNPPTVTVTP